MEQVYTQGQNGQLPRVCLGHRSTWAKLAKPSHPPKGRTGLPLLIPRMMKTFKALQSVFLTSRHLSCRVLWQGAVDSGDEFPHGHMDTRTPPPHSADPRGARILRHPPGALGNFPPRGRASKFLCLRLPSGGGRAA